MSEAHPNENAAPESEVTTPEAEAPVADPILSELDEGAQPAKAEEKPADEAKPTEDEPEDKDKEPESEAKPEAEQEKEDDKKEEEEPLDPKERARRGYEERKKVREERLKRVQEQTKPYIEEAGEDETERRLRTVEVQEYNRVIEHNENALVGEFERAKANPDLQIFNPDNKEQFNPKLYEKAIRDYNAGYITYDNNGNMVELKGSLYQYLTETAEIYQEAIKAGTFKQVRDQRKMKTAADTKPAAPPREDGTPDPVMEILKSD